MVWPGRAAGPAAPAPTSPSPPAEEPRWLTYKCVRCGARVYSGFTASALRRALAGDSPVKPDFFHADCAVETPLDQADLRDPEGTPWSSEAPERP